jgi:hypothetical protein
MNVDCGQLSRILGMIGSAHDGEVVNAGRLATRVLKEAGLTWPQLLTPAEVAVSAARHLLAENDQLRDELARLKSAGLQPRPPRPFEEARTPPECVENLLLWPEHLTTWEEKFLESLLKQRRSFTPRQFEVLASIAEKVERCIRSSWQRDR